jgi:PIN domain nuclease of toxin-antitoxin system
MPGLGVIQVDREVLVESALLEWQHRDPADRLLVATARRYGLRIATADDQLLAYCRGAGSTNVLDVRV